MLNDMKYYIVKSLSKPKRICALYWNSRLLILCKNDTKYQSVIFLQQDLHGNTVSRLFNIYSYFVIIVALNVISFS
jgi:hypothetical protein